MQTFTLSSLASIASTVDSKTTLFCAVDKAALFQDFNISLEMWKGLEYLNWYADWYTCHISSEFDPQNEGHVRIHAHQYWIATSERPLFMQVHLYYITPNPYVCM